MQEAEQKLNDIVNETQTCLVQVISLLGDN